MMNKPGDLPTQPFNPIPRGMWSASPDRIPGERKDARSSGKTLGGYPISMGRSPFRYRHGRLRPRRDERPAHRGGLGGVGIAIHLDGCSRSILAVERRRGRIPDRRNARRVSRVQLDDLPARRGEPAYLDIFDSEDIRLRTRFIGGIEEDGANNCP